MDKKICVPFSFPCSLATQPFLHRSLWVFRVQNKVDARKILCRIRRSWLWATINGDAGVWKVYPVKELNVATVVPNFRFINKVRHDPISGCPARTSNTGVYLSQMPTACLLLTFATNVTWSFEPGGSQVILFVNKSRTINFSIFTIISSIDYHLCDAVF